MDILLQEQTDLRLAEWRRRFVALCQQENLAQWATEANWSTPEARLLRTILNRYEFIAIGVHHKIIDEKSYKASWRSTLVNDWANCKSFVIELRDTKDSQVYFREFQDLAHRWATSEEKGRVRV